MALEARVRGTLRHRLSHLLRAEGGFVTARDDAADVLLPQAEAEMQLPAAVGDYTDFYASIYHATNVGKHAAARQPAAAELQVGADRLPRPRVVAGGERHARAAAVRQTEPAAGASAPAFGPSRSLDYELEVGAFLGPGNALGEPIPLAEAEERIFGLVLRQRLVGARPAEVGVPAARAVPGQELRDLDQPVGRDAGGSRTRSASPAFARPAGDPAAAAPTCSDDEDRAHGGFDLRLEVLLCSRAMRERGLAPAARQPQQPARPVLDARADGRAPRLERLQPAARRPDRERHGLGRGRGVARLPARADLARRAADRAARRAKSGASSRTATR